jgi:hypothetical protein
MTAKSVNGIRVLDHVDAHSPLSKNSSRPIKYRQIRHLLLENGEEWYGCLHCAYASTNFFSIRPHLKKHNKHTATQPALTEPKAAPKPMPKAKTSAAATQPAAKPVVAHIGGKPVDRSLASLNLGQLVEQAQLTDQMRLQAAVAREERDLARKEAADWKDRAADFRHQKDGWKDRAEKAEQRLIAIQQAIKKL